jgi:DNA polymerase I
VIAKYAVPPERIVDLLALMGDTVDNVPGVDKCGPKTAAKWLNEYGSLEGVIENAASIKGKVGDNLREALERLPLNKQLVTIKTDVELHLGCPQLKLRERDVEALRVLYTRYGFNAALRDLDGQAPAANGAPVKPPSGRSSTPAPVEAPDAALAAEGRVRVHPRRGCAGAPGWRGCSRRR